MIKFPVNSLNLMRGFLFIDENKKDKFVDECFDAYWKKNIDISINENIQKILSDCAINQNLFDQGIKDQKIKEKLKNLTNEAFELNIFWSSYFFSK